jgi:hypothetical protein
MVSITHASLIDQKSGEIQICRRSEKVSNGVKLSRHSLWKGCKLQWEYLVIYLTFHVRIFRKPFFFLEGHG